MTRRRRQGKKKYSLAYLLSRQPKSLAKREHYTQLIGFLRHEGHLRQLRFGRKCYSLLHHARVTPQNLASFYRIFGLPRHPFFPLFLALKKGYLKGCAQQKKEKRDYIFAQIHKLPPLLLATIKYLAEYEKSHNRRKQYPTWIKQIFPGSKKKADLLSTYTWIDWVDQFLDYLASLSERYPELDREHGQKIIALYILNLPLNRHSAEHIKAQYRSLSKQYHPDTGGIPREFIHLQWAKEVLLRKK